MSPKKLTVKGIIGNTQGVKRAASPEPNASIEKDQSSCIVFYFFLIVQLFDVDISNLLFFCSFLFCIDQKRNKKI
ncbi:hypothetical protein LPB03_12105 [Polaribacter vadi]|uniref:Uncharacterized protein n=1 Tax=Polaribacter vadi TaxID=1774273 RepID=A0A1B8TTK6_9FLAO|nr:hypothetical protein LPB03_12105 [Polaribacter vadi]OBY62879.1 hypothetical protein LPB3_12120 [Polaribacter vadi]